MRPHSGYADFSAKCYRRAENGEISWEKAGRLIELWCANNQFPDYDPTDDHAQRTPHHHDTPPHTHKPQTYERTKQQPHKT